MEENLLQFCDHSKLIHDVRENLRYASANCNNAEILEKKLLTNILPNLKIILRLNNDATMPDEMLNDLEAFIELFLSETNNLHETTNNFEFFVSSCDLLVLTIGLFQREQFHTVAGQLFDRMLILCNESLESKDDRTRLSLTHCVDLLIRLFSFIETLSEEHRNAISKFPYECVVKNLTQCLSNCDEHNCIRITIELIPKIVAATKRLTDGFIKELWDVIVKSFNETPSGDFSSKADRNGFLLLSCTSDMFFNKDTEAVHIWTEISFWTMIQYGLTHADPLNRKRSVYFLKRALESLGNSGSEYGCELFSWTASESERVLKCFKNVVFVLETLEEKQVHLITPLFPIVQRLIAAATASQDDAEIRPWYLDTSWIVVILRQMLRHDSKTVRRWTVDTVCTMDLMRKSLQKFLVGDFLIALNDPSLYTRQDKTSSQVGVPIEEKLTCHLRHSVNVFGKSYFGQFLRNLHSQAWSSVAFFYVIKSLSSVPPTKLWDRESFDDIKELLSNTLRTHDTLIRGANQGFLLQALLNCADTTTLTLDDISSILLLFKREECLCRGTLLWDSVVQWLRVSQFANETQTRLKLIEKSMTDILTVDADGRIVAKGDREIRRVARFTVLLMDADVECAIKMSVLLEPFVHVLATAHSRCYMPSEKIEVTLKFLIALNTEMNTVELDRVSDSVGRSNSMTPLLNASTSNVQCIEAGGRGGQGSNFTQIAVSTTTHSFDHNYKGAINYSKTEDDLATVIGSSIAVCTKDFLSYLTRRLHEHFHHISIFENYEVHFAYLEILIQNKNLYSALRPHFVTNCKEAAKAFEHDHDQTNKIVAAKCFLLACRFADVSNETTQDLQIENIMQIVIENNQLSTVPKTAENLTFANRTHTRNPKRISSQYVDCLWKCVHFYVQHTKSLDSRAFLQQGIEALQIGGVEWLETIFKCFEILLPQILDTDSKMIETVLDNCWRTLFENKPSIPFWNAVTAFVEMAFQSDLMSAECLTDCLSNFADGFYVKSETYHGLYLPLVKQATRVWTDPLLGIQSLLDHCDLLVRALLFGHNHRRDHKIVQETEEYIVSLERSCSVNSLIVSDCHHDKNVRVAAILLLLKMRPGEMNRIVPLLVTILIETDAKEKGETTRHFANSAIHRVKQRIWQTLLIVEPFYTEDVATKVQQTIFDLLIGENLQLSVRYLMEWLAVRIIMRFGNLLNGLWTAFEKAAATRIGSSSSFLSIAHHLSGVIENEREEFLSATIAKILPFIAVQHFNTRLYAQVTLNKLWQSCKQHNMEKLLNTYRPIETLFTSFIDTRHSGTSRNVQTLNEDYYFSLFHPEKHFTIETIFYDLPRLANVLADEWLKPELFLKVEPNLGDIKLNVPLFNSDCMLSQIKVQSWVLRSTNDLETLESCGDLQKKQIPWKQMIPNYELLAASSQSVFSRKQNQISDGLVVVASLIDKTPNLGGMFSILEALKVFGVSRYVVASLSHVQDKQFQSLSMLSDKWVSIQEVKVYELKDYLVECKKLGYTIIGVEQTANSSKVESFKFPKKSAIVLGNEKEGISAEFIHLMDVCIEIPQQGLIRSLNVHVTGAILIWEYTKQHTLAPTSE